MYTEAAIMACVGSSKKSKSRDIGVFSAYLDGGKGARSSVTFMGQ